MFCAKCGAQIEENAKLCPHCGSLQSNAQYCKFCGEVIDVECVICPKCGKQVGELKQQQQQPQVVINNTNNNRNVAMASARATAGAYTYQKQPKNKWVALTLCICLGWLGIHRFYEGKVGMGILYMFTLGLFYIGWVVDIFRILFKPNPYYV